MPPNYTPPPEIPADEFPPGPTMEEILLNIKKNQEGLIVDTADGL